MLIVMESEKKKKVLFLLGSLVVAAMFLSSYGAFGNNNTAGATTTVIQKPAVVAKTYYVSNNYVNATIYGYSNVSVAFSSNTSNSSIAAMLSALSANGSISNYIGSGYSYKLYLANMTAQSIVQAIKARNLTAAVTATALVRAPSVVRLYFNGYPINSTLTHTNFSIVSSNIMPIGTKIPLHITALVFANGTVYGNNLTCTYEGVECQ
jgi:hypothetical protein